MHTETRAKPGTYASLIRIGGGALLLALVIHIVTNFFLKEFPPADPSLVELKAYLEAEAETWRIIHGMRYLAVVCLALFFGGIFARTHSATDFQSGGWEYVGLIGGLLHVANLLITNGIETFAFLDFRLQAEQPELFWLVFQTTRVLFNAEIVAWAIAIFGFSVAGWKSKTMPRSIVALGYIASSFALLSGLFIGSVMTTGGWPAIAFDVAAISSLAWFLCIGVLMLLRGNS